MTVKQSDTTLRSLVSSVQLGKTDQVLGSVFRKQIMSYGEWINPNYWWDDEIFMELDEALADQMIDNFDKKIYGKRISVPLNHTGDVTANAGEVIKLEKGPGGLWAYLDIRRPDVVQSIEDGLVFDVSMGFDWNYMSQKDGKTYGPVLIHVALVTDPYLNNMDDFQRADAAKLSKGFDAWAENIGFGKSQPSIILMSKDKVEELKRMKFAKVTNDKEHAVEVTYKGDDDKEVTQTIEPGAELEVPTNAEENVRSQIADSTPTAEGEDTEAGEDGGEASGSDAGAGAAGDAAKDADGAKSEGLAKSSEGHETPEQELARLRAERADWDADKAYQKLLSKGRIVPAQKDLFLALCKAGAQSPVALSADVPSLKLTKGQDLSIPHMLSAILEAGPQIVKFGEKGGTGEAKKAELTAEQEEKLRNRGVNVQTFKKRLESGDITLEEENL